MWESLLFSLEAITPIFVLVALGYLLKRAHLANADFCKMANKLVFRVFLPANLFLNVYKIPDLADIDFGYIGYALGVVAVLFLCGIPAVMLVTKHPERRGPTLQVVFRSNFALVGIPLAEALFGGGGALVATLLSALVIPLYNVLAVISLSIFSKSGSKPSPKKILFDIVKNPLICSIVAGLVALGIRAIFANSGITWRLSDVAPLMTSLQYLSNVATPVALLVLGMQFEFSAVRALRREIIFGTVARVVMAPLVGVGVAFLFFRNTFSAVHFAAFVALFATPVAVSSVPMTQEMGGDTALAGQFVVFTTLLSALSIFLASFLLRLAGVL